MPFQRIERLVDGGGAEIGIRIFGISPKNAPDRDMLEVLYADIPGVTWTPGRLRLFEAAWQDRIDFRVSRTDPEWIIDELVTGGDPARANAFWDGPDLVARAHVVDNARWVRDSEMHFRVRQIG